MNQTFTNTLKLSVVAMLICAGPVAAAADWGSLKGRFVVDGQPPELPPLRVDKDQFCIDNKPKNEMVRVGKDNGLMDAVVYLFVPRGTKIDVHPDYAELMKKPVEIDNRMCSFHPHTTTLRVGQELLIKNSDPVGHNTNTMFFNETIPAGETKKKVVDKVTPLPTPVSCGIHPFMHGDLLIQDHPYMAVAGEDGTFEIKNIPAGKREFQLWHETGYLAEVKTAAGASTKRGRLTVTVEPGKTLDLGEIKIPASLLSRGVKK
jgi:plastocyanin